MSNKLYVMRFVSICMLGLWFYSCNKEPIPRISMQPSVLNDEILTSMPGDLVLLDHYLVWTDPFSHDYFLHVHDKVNGEKIGSMGKIGEGPEEFVTPLISRFTTGNNVFAYDVNGKTAGYLSVDSLVKKTKTLIPLSDFENEIRMFKMDDNLYLSQTDNGEDDYFKMNCNKKESTFGVYPIREVKEHIGNYMAYDKRDGLLVFVSFKFPYLALYKKTGDTFELQWERRSEQENYIVEDNTIRYDRKIMGAGDVCMSKDYIVTLERDREADPMDESTVGRNASKCPNTVFIYDYDGKLLKIVNLGMPIMRIAADRNSNTLYAIGVNPDFVLAKYEL